jgi:hypothetical protein
MQLKIRAWNGPMNSPRVSLADLASLHSTAFIVTRPAALIAAPLLRPDEKAVLAELRELWAGFDYFVKTGSVRPGEQPEDMLNRYPFVRGYIALLGNTKRNAHEEKLLQKYKRHLGALRHAFSARH